MRYLRMFFPHVQLIILLCGIAPNVNKKINFLKIQRNQYAKSLLRAGQKFTGSQGSENSLQSVARVPYFAVITSEMNEDLLVILHNTFCCTPERVTHESFIESQVIADERNSI